MVDYITGEEPNMDNTYTEDLNREEFKNAIELEVFFTSILLGPLDLVEYKPCSSRSLSH